MAGISDAPPHLIVQAFDQAAVRFPVGVGVAALGEGVHRGLVFPARKELCLDTDLVQCVVQEQSVGGESDQPDGAGRLHPYLAERRGEVVGEGARVGLSPCHRRLGRGKSGYGCTQFLNRSGRGGRQLHARDEPDDARILGGPVNGGDGVAQQQGPSAAGDDCQWIESGRFRR